MLCLQSILEHLHCYNAKIIKHLARSFFFFKAEKKETLFPFKINRV
jgi:hypothetical protein